MIATRYKKKIGRSGDWDPDTATSHVYRGGGLTLCGRPIGRRIERGGPWETSNWPESHASCEQCIRKRREERQ